MGNLKLWSAHGVLVVAGSEIEASAIVFATVDLVRNPDEFTELGPHVDVNFGWGFPGTSPWTTKAATFTDRAREPHVVAAVLP